MLERAWRRVEVLGLSRQREVEDDGDVVGHLGLEQVVPG